MFNRYIGIDYSGAGTAATRLQSLAVCSIDAVGNAEFPRPRNPRTMEEVNWNRRDVAKWLIERFRENQGPILVGIDHAFSFPIEYFRNHRLPEGQWENFLVDFEEHWPTRGHRVVDLMRDNDRRGDPQWRRLTDRRAHGAQSVFNFHPIPRQSQVATSTHAGLPWLLHIRQELLNVNAGVHFWPFDRWKIHERASVIIEVYPALWNWRFPDETEGMNSHQRDAYSVARWMWEQDQHDLLGQYFGFGMPQGSRLQAQTEGWIFGLLW